MIMKQEETLKNNLESKSRWQILDAAFVLLAQKGYAATKVMIPRKQGRIINISEEARNITGQTINVDGGAVMGQEWH